MANQTVALHKLNFIRDPRVLLSGLPPMAEGLLDKGNSDRVVYRRLSEIHRPHKTAINEAQNRFSQTMDKLSEYNAIVGLLSPPEAVVARLAFETGHTTSNSALDSFVSAQQFQLVFRTNVSLPNGVSSRISNIYLLTENPFTSTGDPIHIVETAESLVKLVKGIIQLQPENTTKNTDHTSWPFESEPLVTRPQHGSDALDSNLRRRGL